MWTQIWKYIQDLVITSPAAYCLFGCDAAILCFSSLHPVYLCKSTFKFPLSLALKMTLYINERKASLKYSKKQY